MEEEFDYLDNVLRDCGNMKTTSKYNCALMEKIQSQNRISEINMAKQQNNHMKEKVFFYNKTIGLTFLTSGVALIVINLFGSRFNDILFLLKNIALNFNQIFR